MCSRVRVAIGIAAAFAVALHAHAARASGPEVFGLGATEPAVAGASAARVSDFSSGFYNPAGLGRLGKLEIAGGLMGNVSQLSITNGTSSHRAPINEPVALQVGLVAPLHLAGPLQDRIVLGIAVSALPTSVLRLTARLPDEPMFVTFDNRSQRLVLLPTIAIRLTDTLRFGLAVNYLAGLRGNVAAADGVSRGLEVRVDESVVSEAAVNLGLRWQALDWLALGLVYRGQFSVPFQTTATTQVAGAPINLDISTQGLFTPHELVLGIAGVLGKLTASLDVEWGHWSGWSGPYVHVKSNLFLLGATDAKPPAVRLHDTGTIRGGLELIAYDKYPLNIVLRGGYAFMSSPVPNRQTGVTNLLDGNHHRLSAGGGGSLSVGPVKLRVDLFGQLEILEPRKLTKILAPSGTRGDPSKVLNDEVADDPNTPSTLGTQTSNAGYPSITGRGQVWSFGAMFTVIK